MRGIWRRAALKEITMRHFPEKQMALQQLLQKFTTEHHFFREIISTSLNETKRRCLKEKHEKFSF